MADYYPLLARALDAMPERTPALRHAVYTRARGALLGQLRSLDPPLSEGDIDLERNALEAAILRLEQDYGTPAPAEPEPAPGVFEPLEPEAAKSEAAKPERTEPEPARFQPEPPRAEPFIPGPANDVVPPEPQRPEAPAAEPFASAPPPDVTSLPKAAVPRSPSVEPVPPREAPVVARPVAPAEPVVRVEPVVPVEPPVSAEPAVRIQARKGKATPPFVAPSDPESAGTASDDAAGIAPEPSVLDGNGPRQRPRIDVVAPREGRSRLLRNLMVGAVLVLVIGLIAVAAFLLRDKPADLQPIATETQDSVQDGADSKFADRVGGEAAPVERSAPAKRSVAPTPIPAQSEPGLTIAQRAVLYEENAGGGTNAAPNATQGRVVWRLDTVPGEQGQPLETVVRAKADFPDAGLAMTMTLRRNLDATLPASHTIELAFTPSGPSAAQHGVQDIGLLQGKDEEGARGSPVSGLPVRVRENLFLIGLSSLPNDIERNTDILLHKNWFDVTLKFSSGLRGIVAFEKGGAGTQVLQAAFDQWRSKP